MLLFLKSIFNNDKKQLQNLMLFRENIYSFPPNQTNTICSVINGNKKAVNKLLMLIHLGQIGE